jgi:flagellar hook-associated protein 3 FlgL
MRVTGQMLVDSMLNNLNQNLARLEKAQQQVSSGKQFSKPSDNPVGLAQALGLDSALSQNQQYLKNADTAKAWLDTTDASLQAVTDTLHRAQELAVQGGNDTLSGAQRRGMAEEVEGLIGAAVQSANATLEGRYIFSGTQTGAAAFSYTPGAPSVTYNGDTNIMARQVGLGTTVDVNVTGDQAFAGVFENLIKLRDALDSDDGPAIRSTTDLLSSAQDTVLQAQASVGARANRTDYVTSQLNDIALNVKELLSKVQDIDLTEAITRMKVEETAYNAALAVAGRTIQPTLLDYLR